MENGFKRKLENADKEIYDFLFETKQKYHLTTPELVLLLNRTINKWLESFCSWQNHSRTQNENELMLENDELRFAAEGMVAAFDTRPNGEAETVTQITRESALTNAKQVLRWD